MPLLPISEIAAFKTSDGKLHETRAAAELWDRDRSINRLAGISAEALLQTTGTPDHLNGFAFSMTPVAESILHLAALIQAESISGK